MRQKKRERWLCFNFLLTVCTCVFFYTCNCSRKRAFKQCFNHPCCRYVL